jgi:hypothetical protein
MKPMGGAASAMLITVEIPPDVAAGKAVAVTLG